MIEAYFVGEPNLSGNICYGVRVNTIDMDAIIYWKWCKDNGINASGVQCAELHNSYWFYFDNEADVVAFKLMWS